MTVNIMIKAYLPWDELPEDAARARRINRTALIIGLLFALIIPNIKLPPPPPTAPNEDFNNRIAQVIQRQQEVVLPPPPPKPLEQKKPEKTDEQKPEENKPKEQVEKEPPSKHATKEQIDKATAKGQKLLKDAGVADALASLRDFETTGMAMAKNPSTGGDLQKNSGEPVGTSRNMLTSRAGANSGGLAYQGGFSSGFGGGVAGGRGGKGDFNLGVKGAKDMKGGLIAGVQGVGGAGNGKGGAGDRGAGGVGKRTQEEIRAIFDRFSGKIVSAYVRATKDDPSLQGVLRLRLTIDPYGSVTECTVASSELNNPELEAKIVAIVRGFNFGADNVEVWKGTFPVNLYPK